MCCVVLGISLGAVNTGLWENACKSLKILKEKKQTGPVKLVQLVDRCWGLYRGSKRWSPAFNLISFFLFFLSLYSPCVCRSVITPAAWVGFLFLSVFAPSHLTLFECSLYSLLPSHSLFPPKRCSTCWNTTQIAKCFVLPCWIYQ